MVQAQLQGLAEQIRSVEREARALTTGLSEAQLWQRPGETSWSIGECLAHLNIVGVSYLNKLEPALAGARARNLNGNGPFRFGLIGGVFVRIMEPPPRHRVNAPNMFAPTPQPGVSEAFGALQVSLLELIDHADGLDLNRVKITSPVTDLLKLSAYEALSAVLAHERRHLWQAARVKEALLGAS